MGVNREREHEDAENMGAGVSPLQSAKHFLPIGFSKRPNLRIPELD